MICLELAVFDCEPQRLRTDTDQPAAAVKFSQPSLRVAR